MTDSGANNDDTRKSVLNSACRLFSDKGFRNATVQDICREADANIAAVNYYFGGKEALYHEVWQHAYGVMEERYPLPCVDESQPDVWLGAMIEGRLKAIFDDGPGGWFPRLVQKEMSDPTEMAADLHETYLMPHMERLFRVVRLLLGESADETRVRCCAVSIHGQYVFFNVARRVRSRLVSGESPVSEKALRKIVADVQRFTFGGIKALRDEMRTGDQGE